MEKAQNLVAIPYKSNWSDLGGGILFGQKVIQITQEM